MIWQAIACGIDADAGSRGREIPRFGLLKVVHVGMVMHGNVTCHVWERLLGQTVSNLRGRQL
jgi:hypothetical protein